MNTQELLIVTLAIVILVATYLTITPSITGLAIIGPTFTFNNNIINDNGIQLKQHNITETESTNETVYYTLTFAETTKDELQNLIALDDKALDLEKELLKIKFNNNLETGDKINFYLTNTNANILNIYDFTGNGSLYGSLSYPAIEGHYQTTLTIEEPTNELSVYSVENKTKINYINASHLETTGNQTITYYYNSDSIESNVIQPSNLSKWDIFTSDHTLNNQIINFYYKTDGEYIEFTPPYNFSSIDSSNLQFKLTLISDNSSTPIINDLTINYIEEITIPCQENWTCTDWGICTNETQTRTCTETNECGTQENQPQEIQNCTETSPPPPSPPSSSGAPSSRSSSPRTTTTTQTESSPAVQTKSVSQPVIMKSAPEPEIAQPQPNIKIIGNTIGFSYLAFLCLLLYRRKHKL